MNLKQLKLSIMIITIRQSNPKDSHDIIKLWRDSVKATHHFLSEQDFNLIYQEVSQFIPQTPVTLAINQYHKIVGFMLHDKNHIEALFINHTLRGQGIGRKLIDIVLLKYSTVTITVNEQNTQALQFYQHLGFQQTHRTKYDQQNRPYPLLYLRYTPNQ